MSEFSERDRDNISKTHDMITRLTPIIERHERDIDVHEKKMDFLAGEQRVHTEQIHNIKEDVSENKGRIIKAFEAISKIKTLVAEVTVKRMVALIGAGAAIIVGVLRFMN